MPDEDAHPEGRSPATGSLRGNRNFRVFLVAQTLSSLGDSFSYVAIPLLVLHTTGSVVQMGAVTALAGVSSIVTGLVAGYLADRMNRRRLLIACDVARCLLFALVPVVWLVSPQVWLLYAVVPLAAAFGMQFQVTYVTFVPALVEAGQITRANGHLYAAYSVAGVAGPTLAGVLSGLAGPAAAIAIDAASFAISAAGLLLVRPRPAPGGLAPATPETSGAPEQDASVPPAPRGRVLVADFLAGARFLWGHPVLRSLTVLLSLLVFVTFGVTDVIVYYLKNDLGTPDSTVGYVLAAATVGSLLAATVVAPARGRLGFGACWIGAWALAGVTVALLGFSPGALAVGALATAQLFCTGLAGICSMSLRQEVTPGHLLGRVTSAFWTIHSALGPLGAALLTAAAARYGVAAACLAAGTVCAAVALSALATPIRRSRPERLQGEATA
ncbi:MFS transporter [Sphaerisporangium krabiense]|uniref:MFS family permease n=1 Tax=Sphaerisporangium krabiense TaxID=763782 RepID=A0A7W8ZCQ2_9ACTN|nr:MFS transporter [Sphaerisporangium krabiense]MBB5631623.1 MFS family permease [Sphaerisporangium krabiense]GII61037.1 MFS transporter [Sphaerisporangium krabiense]